MAKVTKKRLLRLMEGKHHDAKPRYSRKRWHPIECEQGCDLCPMSDAPEQSKPPIRRVGTEH